METIAGLDPEALNRARISRDPRFDGKFFIAVPSTGIYCRPICPSRWAKRANVRFFGSTAAAEAAGFRPCLRCRPETAPGTPAWLGTAAVVRRALRLIDDGALDEDSVEALAARLGIGSRHLVRLFRRHVGASPIAVAQTRRLHFAVCLLEASDLPITQIAMAAGFGSSRRFNDAFRATYRRSPRELRKAGRRTGGATAGDRVILRLAYRPPDDWEHMREFLAARAIGGLERVDAGGYARTVACPGGHALVAVRALPGKHALELRVAGAPAAALLQLSSVVRSGEEIRDGIEGLTRLFPTPAALVRANLDGLGITGTRVAALRSLARAVLDGRVDFSAASADVATALAALPGVGPWTAQYVALRALGEPDALPYGDWVLRRMAARGAAPLTAQQLEQRSETWRPWRSYATVYLWQAAGQLAARKQVARIRRAAAASTSASV